MAQPVVLSMRNACFEFHSHSSTAAAVARQRETDSSEEQLQPTAIDNTDNDAAVTEFVLSNISFQVVSGRLLQKGMMRNVN